MKKLLLILLAIIPITANSQRIVYITPVALFPFDPITAKYVPKSLAPADTYIKAWRNEGADVKLIVSTDSLNWSSKYYVKYVDTTLIPRMLKYLKATNEQTKSQINTKIYDFPISKTLLADFEHDIQSIKRFFATPIITLDSTIRYNPFEPNQLSSLMHNFQIDAAKQNNVISIFAVQKSETYLPENVYVSTIEKMLPYDNNLVMISITGTELMEMLENSAAATYKTVRSQNNQIIYPNPKPISVAGIQYTIDLTKPYPKKITQSSIIPQKIYTAITNSFIAKNHPQIIIGNYKILLINYLKDNPKYQNIEKWVVIPQRWVQNQQKNYLQNPHLYHNFVSSQK